MSINFMIYTALTLLMILMPILNVHATTKLMDWRHLQQAPSTISLLNPIQTLVIQADDLDLGHLTFPTPHTQTENLPQNVILMADTLRLSQLATFELSNRNGIGGNLLIIARQIVVGEDGGLNFRTVGVPCGNLRIFYGSTHFLARTKPQENGGRFQFVTQQLQKSAFSRSQGKFNSFNATNKARQILSSHKSVDIFPDAMIRQSTWTSEYPITFRMSTALKGAVWFTGASYTAQSGELILSQDLGADVAKYVAKDARLYLSQAIMAKLSKLQKPIETLKSLGNRSKLVAHLQALKTLVMMGTHLIVDSDRQRYQQQVIELIKLYPSPILSVSPVIVGDPMMGEEQMVIFWIKNYEDEEVFCSTIQVRARIADSQNRFVAWHNVIARDVVIPANKWIKQEEASFEILEALKQQFEQPRIVDLDKTSFTCKLKWISAIGIDTLTHP